MDTEWKHKSTIVEILPNTKRTQERLQKQQEEEEKKRLELQNRQRAMEEQEMQMQQLLKEKAQQKKLEDDRKREEERRNQEELQQINTLKGEFGNMINDLKTDQSKLDYTISGLDLRPAQIRILVKVAETNNTLKGLSMSRKRIADQEGSEIIKSMEKNTVLERIELEGNNLGPQTVTQVAKLLENNRSIRVLDLENNNLTNQDKDTYQQDNSGIIALCEALKTNDALLSLNLTNCRLDKACGKALMEALEVNKTLISVDLSENPNMGLKEVQKCQDYLTRNKTAYDDERYREFIERKRLCKEDQFSTMKQIQKEEEELAQEGIEVRMYARREELERLWREELEKEQKIRDKAIHNLQKQAKLLGKKGKKGGGGKKKK